VTIALGRGKKFFSKNTIGWFEKGKRGKEKGKNYLLGFLIYLGKNSVVD
jgi:hypothetical protein